MATLHQSPTGSREPDPRAPLAIVIADARPDTRSALRLLLREETDLRVSAEAADAAAALTALTQHPAAVVLLDCDLPGLPLARLVRALRAVQPAVPIVVMSARPEARNAALLAGATAFLSKGAPPETVPSTLRAAAGAANWPVDQG